MSEYRIYTPSAEGYKLFRENLKKADPDWLKKELALLKDFSDTPENTNKDIVSYRVRKLNSAYSTRISNVELDEIEKIILQPGFDEKLDDGYEAVEKLRRVPSQRQSAPTRDYLSFATKYCHHCLPDKFPIYDSVNVRVLSDYSGYKDKRNYTEYVECFKQFCLAIRCSELKANEGFYVDKYIQAIGIHSELLFSV